MKNFCFYLFLFFLPQLFISQLKFPEFLQGTWQVENKEQFEQAQQELDAAMQSVK